MAGCGKDRTTNPVIQPPPYPVLSSPANVLTALQKAYVARDTTEYILLFDGNYQGSSIDQTDPSPQPTLFTKADEAHHIASLVKSTTVTDVELDLKPELLRFSDGGDPPGWATIQNPVLRLQINDGPSSYIISVATESMEFKFIPTTPDSTSPTDTTWKIIRWTEVKLSP